MGVNHETVEAFLEAFSCDPASFSEEHHSFPVGAHPLTTNPVLRVEEGYLVPVPQLLPEKMRPRMEDLLRSDSVAWERYARVRAGFLETEAVRLLANAIPGTQSWTALTWPPTPTTATWTASSMAEILHFGSSAKPVGSPPPFAEAPQQERPRKLANSSATQPGNMLVWLRRWHQTTRSILVSRPRTRWHCQDHCRSR